jgi:hypothetical protein
VLKGNEELYRIGLTDRVPKLALFRQPAALRWPRLLEQVNPKQSP